MILLTGHSLNRARKVPLEALSLSLKERESTATMTPADMSGIGTESWLLDDTDPGAGIVWRVKSIGTAYATNTPTVQLEHVISTLKDRILFGEVTPATITGNAKAETCTARQAVEYILRSQGDWTLGAFEYSVSNAYKFDGDTLFDALETVTHTLADAEWTYDLTRYPFRLNITRKSGAVGSELRCGRNLRTITRNIDRSGMYTRFYPIGYDDIHLSPAYRDRNTAAYGIIEHTATDTSRTSAAELEAWASEMLQRHAEPVVSIEVEGLELVQATGESLDRLTLGRMCRVPLPEFGTTITERITALTYQDKLNQPEVVRITLANNIEDVTRIIADNIKTTSRGGRGAVRTSKQDHAWFEDTNDHVAMVAEGIVGVDAEGNPNWTLLSEIIVDGTGIHQNVVEVQNGLTLAETNIEQNSRAIALEAKRAEGVEATLIIQAEAIEGRVTNAEGDIGTLTLTAEEFATRITSAEGDIGELKLTSEGFETRITDAEGDIGDLKLTADTFEVRITGTEEKTKTLTGRIIVEAGTASLVAELTDNRPIVFYDTSADFPETGDTGTIYLDLTSQIYYEWTGSRYKICNPDRVIKASSITTAINEAGESETHIDSDHVYIGNSKSTTVINGKVDTTDFTAVKATVDNLTGLTIKENYVGASLVTGTTVTAVNTFTHAGDTIWKRGLKWKLSDASPIATIHAVGTDATSIVLNHSHEMTVDASGNVTIGDAQVTTGNFNIADTAFYITGVSAARTDGWTLARGYVVPPEQQTANAYMDFGVPAINYNDSSSYRFTVTEDGSYAYIKNALNQTVARTPLSGSYDQGKHDGWDLARGYVDPPDEQTANAYMDFGVPAVSYDSSSSYRYTVSVDNDYAYIKNAANRVVARVRNVKTTQHNNCADGLTKSGAYNVVYVPDDTGTTISIKVKNISAAGRYWYYRGSEQNLFTAYT